jgi:hypothetical protein
MNGMTGWILKALLPVACLVMTQWHSPSNADTFQLRAQSGDHRMSTGTAVRPDWIPLDAFTNEVMIGVYSVYSVYSDGSIGYKPKLMPEEPTVLNMASDISREWGPGWNRDCKILVRPLMEHPGNFYFTSGSSNGPRGWLQHTGERAENGCFLYRYWFDQKPATAPGGMRAVTKL